MTSEPVPAIELVAYDEDWPARYELARGRIVAVLPQADVHHVGSTSVPGLVSKPTIDVLACVDRAAPSQEVVAALTSVRYEYRPRSFAASPERHLFFRVRADGRRLEHVHVVDAGSLLAQDYLVFRDFLRTHRSEADAYAAEKQRLLRECRGDRAWYVDNKIPVVDAMMSAARAWYGDQARWCEPSRVR